MKHICLSRFLLVVCCLIGFGCVPREPVAPAQPAAPQLFTHVIRYEGETLAGIAQWYLGRAADWKVLLEYNPEIKPTRLRMGQAVLIPQARMKREDALPRPQAKKSAGPNTEAKSQAPVVNSDEEQTPLEAISTDEAAQDVVPETTDQISGGSAIKQAESPIEKEDTSQVSKDGVSVTSETSMNTETVDAPTAIENGVEPTARTISDEQSSEVTAVPAETEPVHQAVELPKATAEEPASAGDPEELSREELWEKLLRVD